MSVDQPNGRSTACRERMHEVCQGYTEPLATYGCACTCHEVGLPDCPVCRQPVDGITYGGLPHTPRLALLPEVTGAIEPLSFELLPCQCRILGYLTAENRIKRWEVLR